jgi:hypothetical protein
MEAFEVAHERQLRERTISKASTLLGIASHAQSDVGVVIPTPVWYLSIISRHIAPIPQAISPVVTLIFSCDIS